MKELTITEDELERFCINPDMASKCADYVRARIRKWMLENTPLPIVSSSEDK